LQDVLYQGTDSARGFLGSINGNKEILSKWQIDGGEWTVKVSEEHPFLYSITQLFSYLDFLFYKLVFVSFVFHDLFSSSFPSSKTTLMNPRCFCFSIHKLKILTPVHV
jgi:hypothetical protein